jgi:hypothetical protein
MSIGDFIAEGSEHLKEVWYSLCVAAVVWLLGGRKVAFCLRWWLFLAFNWSCKCDRACVYDSLVVLS